MMSTKRANLAFRGIALSAIFAVGVGAPVIWHNHLDSNASSAAPIPQDSNIVLGEGAGRLPASSAADWAGNADYVVQATVMGEQESPPSAEEVERGEGIIFRDLDLNVDAVLWSAPDVVVAAPETLTWKGFGWIFKGGIENRQEMGSADAPRLEVGHTYAIAISWDQDSCTNASGKWVGLSSQGFIPFDETLGNGEFEGREVTPSEIETIDAGRTFREELAGEQPSAIADELDSTTPRAAKQAADICD